MRASASSSTTPVPRSPAALSSRAPTAWPTWWPSTPPPWCASPARLRLASAIAPRLANAGDGAIINIGSVVGLAPEFGMSVYGATKAFVLFLSQGLSLELTPLGVYVQAVLP